MGRSARAETRLAPISAARPRACAPKRGGGLGREALRQRGTDETAQHISAAAGRQAGIPGGDGEEPAARPGHDRGDALEQNGRTRFFGSGACRCPRIELANRREGRKQRPKLARVRREHERPAAGERPELRRSALKGHERIRVEHDRAGGDDECGDEGASPRRAPEPGTDDDGIGATDRASRSASEGGWSKECANVCRSGSAWTSARYGIGRRHGMNQPGARGKGRPGGETDRARHPRVPTHDDDAPARSLVVAAPEPPKPLGGLDVVDEHRATWDRPADGRCR